MPPIYENAHPLPQEGDVPLVVERIEWTHGARIHLEGHPYPLKGYPTADAISAINVIKKLLPFLWAPRIRKAAMMALYPYVMVPEYMLPVSREFRHAWDSPLGNLLAHVLEYDSAYRVRFQMMLSDMSDRPILSVLKMLHRNKTLDYKGAHCKIRAIGLILILLLLVPSNRRAFRRFRSHVPDMLPDEGDMYWFNLRTDYGPKNGNPIISNRFICGTIFDI